jgi:nucleoside-diphosphate-sugar epimerase
MKVFITGATGFIGSAIVQELLHSGHQVLGLARSDEKAAALKAVGAEVHPGSLEDLESLRRGADLADGVIHTGFNHDFSKFKANCEADMLVIEAIGSVLSSSNRPFVVTSGIGILPAGQMSNEETRPATGAAAHPRAASEEAVQKLSGRGVPVSIVRLPPSVHGDGDHAFVPILINLAREKGISAYIGTGANRWPAVHRLDAARLFRLALQRGRIAACYHGVAEEGVPFREIAEVIGRRLNLPTVSLDANNAAGYFGWFAHFAAMNVPASSQRTRALLGWEPSHPGLIADLKGTAYFKS